jgi:hypothetical protein
MTMTHTERGIRAPELGTERSGYIDMDDVRYAIRVMTEHYKHDPSALVMNDRTAQGISGLRHPCPTCSCSEFLAWGTKAGVVHLRIDESVPDGEVLLIAEGSTDDEQASLRIISDPAW